jgi:hypothetical protein
VQSAFTDTDTATFSLGANNTGNNYFCFNRSGFSPVAYTGTVQIDSTPVNKSLRRCVVVSGVGHAQVVASGGSDVNGVTCP